MENKMNFKNSLKWVLILLCLPVAVYFSRFTGEREFYFACILCLAFATAAFFLSYENRKPDSREITILAVMCALAVGGRAAFVAIPYVKPLGPIIIITGAVLGSQAGFLCGAISCLLSNFIFGQGPWTVWQMVAFGLMGAVAGLVFYKKEKLLKPWFLAFYGFVSTVLICGPILDLSGLLLFPGYGGVVSTLMAGFPINLVSGASNAVFLLILSAPVVGQLQRVITKYGMKSK